MDTITYLPVQRTAAEQLKWLEIQSKLDEIKANMGDKWLLAKPLEKLNG